MQKIILKIKAFFNKLSKYQLVLTLVGAFLTPVVGYFGKGCVDSYVAERARDNYIDTARYQIRILKDKVDYISDSLHLGFYMDNGVLKTFPKYDPMPPRKPDTIYMNGKK